MSKKKNKFKKKKHHAVNAPVANLATNIVASVSESTEQEPDSTPQPIKNVEPPVSARPSLDGDHYTTDKYDHVKKDIKKILIIMLIIILILVGIYVLSLKTTILDTFGNWVYRILNIQTS